MYKPNHNVSAVFKHETKIAKGVWKRLTSLLSVFCLQNKLHDNEKMGNRRVSCTIATHDLAKVKFPLAFKAKKPDDINVRSSLIFHGRTEVTGRPRVERSPKYVV